MSSRALEVKIPHPSWGLGPLTSQPRRCLSGQVNSAVIVSRTNEGIMKDKLETRAAESASFTTGKG